MTTTQTAGEAARTGDAAPRLVLERRYSAPIDLVYQAWTDPTMLSRWFGPEGFTVPSCELDVRAGGRYRICMRGPDGDLWISGQFKEVSPPNRLVFSWAWETDGERGHETEVRLELAREDGATRLTLTHSRFESESSRDGHEQGWSSSLVKLERLVAESA